MFKKDKKSVKNLILLGFRGCGKSTIAKKISQKTSYKFVDLDQEIQTKAKKSIQEITKNGQEWEKFRVLETNTILRLFGFQKQVIAVGGGFAVNDVAIQDPKIQSLNQVSKQVNFKNYGELQTFILQQRPENFKIYLKLEETEILDRLLKIYRQEENLEQRPKLSADQGFKFEPKIEDWFKQNLNLDTEKELAVKLKNDLHNFLQRKEKYEKIADLTVTNNSKSVEKLYQSI